MHSNLVSIIVVVVNDINKKVKKKMLKKVNEIPFWAPILGQQCNYVKNL